MIKLDNYSAFKECESTLQKISYDKDNKKYMTYSNFMAIDFDKVKNEYCRILCLSDFPASNDALAEVDGEVYFIEFKNGNMKSEIYDVRRKIFESLLLFCDITKTTISESRKYLNYILVYNKAESKEYIEKLSKEKLERNEVQESYSYDQMLKTMAHYASSKYDEYNLDFFGLRKKYEKLYFKHVYTYDKNDFNQIQLFV